VGVANDNCPGQVVISGDRPTLERAIEEVRAAGARRVVRLRVSIAAHSPLMSEAADRFRRALEKVALRRPTVPVVANATARPLEDPARLREALVAQFTSPVRWVDAVRWLLQQGVRRFIEVGPGNVLTGLLRRIDRGAEGLTTEQVLGGSV